MDLPTQFHPNRKKNAASIQTYSRREKFSRLRQNLSILKVLPPLSYST